MSAARDAILARIRAGLGRGAPAPEAAAAADRRLAEHRANLVPARGRRPPEDRIKLFIQEAERVDAVTRRVPGFGAVPDAVADFLASERLPTRIRRAPDPLLRGIPWSRRPELAWEEGAARAADEVSVTAAFAGIAETGTVMLRSGPTAPTTLNFLPDTHIVMILSSRIVPAYEDGWALLRAEARGNDVMPRAVNFITGPSRSGDIEQTLLLGAHGPRRLLLVVVDGE